MEVACDYQLYVWRAVVAYAGCLLMRKSPCPLCDRNRPMKILDAFLE